MTSWDIESLSQRLLAHSATSPDSHLTQARTKVSPTQGFHIISTTRISGLDTSTSSEHCSVSLLQLVPPDFIVDEYELNQRFQEGYGPLCHVIGERDLELPAQAVGNRSAAILAELPLQFEVKVDIPLHLRYPYPQQDVELVELQLPWPWVVVACGQQEPNGRQFLDQFFNNKTITTRYTLAAPSGHPHPSSHILVPTGNTSHQLWVEIGTLLSVFLTFLYVAWNLQKSWRTINTKLKSN